MGKETELPRNYVSNLEAQVAQLSRENEELRARARTTSVTSAAPSAPAGNDFVDFNTSSSTASAQTSSPLLDVVESVKDVVVEPSGRPTRFLGQGGGITLARLVMAAIRVDALPSSLVSTSQARRPTSSTMAAEASLPPRHAAERLVETYFQYRTPHLPIIQRSQVNSALDGAYRSAAGITSDERQTEKDTFTAYMVFAIALCGVPGPSGNGRPIQSDGCFRSAMAYVENVIAYEKSDVESLRLVLLLAQFVALCPSQGSLWHLAGIALRMCIDTGLHWETDEQRLSLSPAVLHDRRRLWYCAYQFDRSLSITLGRPFGIIDESARVELPNPWTASRRPLDNSSDFDDLDIYNQRAHNHLFKMSQLESEIVHVQHSQTWAKKIAYPRPNYAFWVKDIEPRLQEWYTTVPEPSKAHPSSIFACKAYWDTVYNNAILLLHRPNSMVPHVSLEDLSISFDASSKMIASLKVLQREGKVDVLWKGVHQLFMAGLGVIYCLWHSKEIRDRRSVGSCILTLQSCASTLSAMSETFPGASGCRDVFDTLSSATINWLVTYDAEKIQQNRQEFDEQLRVLLQQLQESHRIAATPNEGHDDSILASLPTDSFAFSELLSFAAQWPGLQDFGSSGIEFYSII